MWAQVQKAATDVCENARLQRTITPAAEIAHTGHAPTLLKSFHSATRCRKPWTIIYRQVPFTDLDIYVKPLRIRTKTPPIFPIDMRVRIWLHYRYYCTVFISQNTFIFFLPKSTTHDPASWVFTNTPLFIAWPCVHTNCTIVFLYHRPTGTAGSSCSHYYS